MVAGLNGEVRIWDQCFAVAKHRRKASPLGHRKVSKWLLGRFTLLADPKLLHLDLTAGKRLHGVSGGISNVLGDDHRRRILGADQLINP